MRVIFNGSLIDEKDAQLPVSDKAVWFDFGIYESIKVIQGKAFYPDKHVKRFFHSAALINLQMGFIEQQVLQWIDMLIKNENLDNALLRLFAYGDTEKNEQARIYMFSLGLTFYPNLFYSQGAEAITYTGERFLPESKSFNMLVNFLAFKKARDGNAIEALLVNKNGFVGEGTRSNLFIVEKNQIFTPPVKDVLNGVTRELLIEWTAENNIIINEQKISKEQLYSATEVFITSTSMNIMPIVMIDQKQIGNGTVGEITKNLHQLFRKKQREYFKKQ